MKVIIYLLVTASIIFMPYYAGKLLEKTNLGLDDLDNNYERYYFGFMFLSVLFAIGCVVVGISQAIINAIM